MKYSEGEEVLARHPTTAEYYKGKVLSRSGSQYQVEFEPGMEYTVHQDDIKPGRPSRSTTRMSTRVARKSPSKYSSGRRSPGRRSPGRPPSSSKKLAARSTRLPKVSLSRIDTPNDNIYGEKTVPAKSTNEVDSSIDAIPLQSRLKEIGTATRRSARLLSASKTITDHKLTTLTRNINRAVSLPVERRSEFQDFMLNVKGRGHSVQRDPDIVEIMEHETETESTADLLEKRKMEINIVNQPQEWGGRFGVLILILLFPLSIILPHVVCPKNVCTFDFNTLPTNNLYYYFNLHAFMAYLGFLTFLTCTSLIPIGKLAEGQLSNIGTLQYRMNGIYCAVASVIVFSTFVYNGFGIADFILDNLLPLSVSGWILGIILSILLNMKASRTPLTRLNMYACTDSVIYNFWQGREINPRIGKLDVKIILLRASLIGTLLVNLAIMLKLHTNVAVCLATFFEIFYVLDSLTFESAALTSFEVMYEGTGYMLCTGHLLYPFLPTITTKFILYENPPVNYYFGLFLLSYTLGYVLYRLSNSQKDEFRRNPFSSRLDKLETLPTTRGKRLIVSGLWGFVRHPNYLGDLIMQWSIAGISMSQNILPYYPAICCTLALAYRARRDHERCKARYGLAWEHYTWHSKYMILNHIF